MRRLVLPLPKRASSFDTASHGWRTLKPPPWQGVSPRAAIRTARSPLQQHDFQQTHGACDHLDGELQLERPPADDSGQQLRMAFVVVVVVVVVKRCDGFASGAPSSPVTLENILN